MNSVLLTRDKEQNHELLDFLQKKGYKIYEIPFVKYLPDKEKIEYLKKTIEQFEIVITSNYAACLIARNLKGFNLTIHTVGSNSSNILQNAGFKIKTTHKNARSLNDFLINYKSKNNNTTKDLLYLRGNNITQNLPNISKEELIYKSFYIRNLSNYFEKLIFEEKIEILTFFSVKTAEAFIESIHNLNKKTDCIIDKVLYKKIFCFSKKIAKIFEAQNFKTIYVSEEPDFECFKKLFNLN